MDFNTSILHYGAVSSQVHYTCTSPELCSIKYSYENSLNILEYLYEDIYISL